MKVEINVKFCDFLKILSVNRYYKIYNYIYIENTLKSEKDLETDVRH